MGSGLGGGDWGDVAGNIECTAAVAPVCGGVEMRGQCGAAADFHELSLQVQCGRKVA